MAGEGKVGYKRKTRNKVRLEKQDSDESDEDYEVSKDEELVLSEDEYSSSLAEDESDESLGEFEEEGVEKKVKTVKSPRRGRRRKNSVSSDSDFASLGTSDHAFNLLSEEEREQVKETCSFLKRFKSNSRSSTSLTKTKEEEIVFAQRTRPGASNFDFTISDEEIEKDARRFCRRFKSNSRSSTSMKKTTDEEIVHAQRTRPGASDFDLTIPDEEIAKETIRFCRRFKSHSRGSTSMRKTIEEEIVPAQRTCPGRKGKEKVVYMKIEVEKQVCGICLSEEGKGTIRGILNCCSHYFCFACILEWSKVESRCPLCKQRFETIRSDGGHDLRESVISVPQRDQVYQPSEEELTEYLDPYENVICTECHHDGDDAYMLHCDICDSPSHTFCVGLGREVPEGNWYCDGCMPTALASLNSQPLNPTTNHGANDMISSPVGSSASDSFDLNEMYVPETPLTQLAGHSPSPRHFIGQVSSTVPGSDAFSLQARQQILRSIHQMLSNESRQSSISSFGSQTEPQNSYLGEILPEYNNPLLNSSPRFNNIRGQQASTSMDHSPYLRHFIGDSQVSPTVPRSGAFNFQARRQIQHTLQHMQNSWSRQPDRSDSPVSLVGSHIEPQNNYLERLPIRGQEFRAEVSTSMEHYFLGQSQPSELPGINSRNGGNLSHPLRPCNSRSNSGHHSRELSH